MEQELIAKLDKIGPRPITQEDCAFMNQLFIAEGVYGATFRISSTKLMKIFFDEQEYAPLPPQKRDADILLDLQNIGCIPKLYDYCPENYIVTEFIDGQYVEPFLASPFHLVQPIIRSFLTELVLISKRGYLATDLHFDNISLANGRIYILDVGAFKKSPPSAAIELPIWLSGEYFTKKELALLLNGYNIKNKLNALMH